MPKADRKKINFTRQHINKVASQEAAYFLENVNVACKPNIISDGDGSSQTDHRHDNPPASEPLESDSNNLNSLDEHNNSNVDCDNSSSVSSNLDLDESFNDRYNNHISDSEETVINYDHYDTSTKDSEKFKTQLATWATTHSIPQSAVTDLLKLLKVSTFHREELPSDARTLLKTPRKCIMKDIGSGEYTYLGIASNVVKIFRNSALKNTESIQLLVNIDGLPILKSTNSQLWPILGSFYSPSEISNNVFPIALYYGDSKPQFHERFFEDFVNEANSLIDTGIKLDEISQTIPFGIFGFICDAPARAFCFMIKSHTGYYSCGKCEQQGKHVLRSLTLPYCNSRLRTDESFRLKRQEQHHTGKSILENIQGVGPVSSVPYEAMHLVYLGVTRKLMHLWKQRPSQGSIKKHEWNELSLQLEDLHDDVPSEYKRKPRTLRELDRWKATEFRQFVLYVGPAVLKNILPTHIYEHFLSFHFAISILSSSKYCEQYVDDAEKLLVHFVQSFGGIYGKHTISYNVHGLIHLPNDVRKFGTLEKFSAFKFENYLGLLKKKVRKSEKIIQQLSNRLSEISENSCTVIPSVKKMCVSKEHSSGPLLHSVPCAQYKQIDFATFGIKVSEEEEMCCDSCFSTENEIACAKNIIVRNGETFVVASTFQSISELYEKPETSRSLGIYKVSNLSVTIKEFPVAEIVGKYVALHLNRRGNDVSWAVFPMLHTEDTISA